jgi:hypothetical protein
MRRLKDTESGCTAPSIAAAQMIDFLLLTKRDAEAALQLIHKALAQPDIINPRNIATRVAFRLKPERISRLFNRLIYPDWSGKYAHPPEK